MRFLPLRHTHDTHRISFIHGRYGVGLSCHGFVPAYEIRTGDCRGTLEMECSQRVQALLIDQPRVN